MSTPFSPRSARRVLGFGIWLLFVLLSEHRCRAAPGDLEDQAQARRSYEHALALSDQGQARAALAEFERAYQLFPSFRIFYNIAVVNVTLDDPAAALRAFDRYLAEGGSQIDAERRKDVEERMVALSGRAGVLHLHVDTPGALVLVDEREIGRSPLEHSLWLNPGRHHVEVRLSNRQAQEKSFEVLAGGATQLSFVLTPSKAAPPAAHAVPSTSAARKSALPWAAYGVTAALGVGTIVTGVLALGAHNEERDLEHRLTTQQELQAAQRKVDHLALASDILLAATVAGAGVSVYVTLVAHDETPQAVLVIGPGQVSAFARF